MDQETKKNGLPNQDIRHLLGNAYSQEEAQRIFRKLHEEDAEYGKALKESMNKVWNESEEYTCNAFQENSYKKEAAALLKKINKKPFSLRPYIRRGLSIASSILVLLAIGIASYNYLFQSETVYSNITTGFGEIRTLRLSDGTLLTLNACSKVRFPEKFQGGKRRIELEGEAWFEVARNDKQPFTINTRLFDVKVLGTEFNVKAYAADKVQTVNVKSGKVQVEMPDATLRLTANEQLRMDVLTDDYNKYRENQPAALWKAGQLHFDRTPIRDVVNELERRYHCTIILQEGQDFDNLISGEHTNPDLLSVLKSIEYTSGIHYRQEESGSFLLYK
jgi:ferric-dicitrate binding protein FerR (iron transport regulator)